jgi:hypothetical protein
MRPTCPSRRILNSQESRFLDHFRIADNPEGGQISQYNTSAFTRTNPENAANLRIAHRLGRISAIVRQTSHNETGEFGRFYLIDYVVYRSFKTWKSFVGSVRPVGQLSDLIDDEDVRMRVGGQRFLEISTLAGVREVLDEFRRGGEESLETVLDGAVLDCEAILTLSDFRIRNRVYSMY